MPHCESITITERPGHTELGYRRFRCLMCTREFNERRGTPVDQQVGGLDFIRKEATPNDGSLPMQLSREARLVAGIPLFAVPTIMYGGITLLGILTKGTSGLTPGEGRWMTHSGHCSARGTRRRGGGSYSRSCSRCCLTRQRYRPSSRGRPGSAPRWRRWPSRAGFSASPSCRPSDGYFTSEQQASSVLLWSWLASG
jgi:hypothetical protein